MRPAGRYAVPVASAALAIWVAVDVFRQRQLGVDDAGLYFVVAATSLASVAAIAVGRRAQHQRLALLIIWWLVASVGSDVGIAWPYSRVAVTVFFLLNGVSAAAYGHMALAYPNGRITDRVERLFVWAIYLVGVLWMAVPAMFTDPRRCTACSFRVPSLVFSGTTFNISAFGNVFATAFIALGAIFVGLVVRRVRSSPVGAQLTMLPLAVAAVFAAAQLVVSRIAFLAHWDQASGTLAWVDRIVLLILPAAIVAGVVVVQRRRGPLGDLIVELGAVAPSDVRAALARSVGDASLEIALWLPDQGRFVDEDGHPANLTDRKSSGRAVTVIGSSDRPLAAIVHDERLVGQRPILEAAGSAAHLALENARLQAELRAQLVELQASRSRLVAAGDAERRRLERDLHDGAQQRLLAVGLTLQLLSEDRSDPELLTHAQEELQTALHELREMARGIHPAILTEKGLPAAVNSLLDRSTVPVRADIACGRHPPHVESAAYFVVSEALANITKHSAAESGTVSIYSAGDRLVVQVTDNGMGGAAVADGTGLQGLADRVGALNGRFSVESPAGQGTTIRAEIPCASS